MIDHPPTTRKPEPWLFSVLDGNEKALAILRLKRVRWRTTDKARHAELTKQILQMTDEIREELGTCF
jgi:hypothetical protein